MWSLGGRVKTPAMKTFTDVQFPQCGHKRSKERIESAYGEDELFYHGVRVKAIPI